MWYKRAKWTAKYKRSIDCSHPKGFSQRAHCQGRKKRKKSSSHTNSTMRTSTVSKLSQKNTIGASATGEYREPWQMTSSEYIEANYKGHIPSDAYKSYRKSSGLSWIKPADYPVPLRKVRIDDSDIEIRKKIEKRIYVKRDDNGEHMRDANGNLVFMNDAEKIEANLPLEEGVIGAFHNDTAIGFASDEFGSSGVWVVEEFQRKGIGTILLDELHRANPRLSAHPLGQMTDMGKSFARKYHKHQVRKALDEHKPVPDHVLSEYPDLAKSLATGANAR